MPKYSIIEKRLGVKFRNKQLLKLSFTHSSCVSNQQEKVIKKSNETLEFLGDAVLELLTREYLFEKLSEADEGTLSEAKKIYTNTETLHKIGQGLELGKFLIMNKGEELCGGRDRSSNIAGCLEALIGAVYLDRGLKYAKKFVMQTILSQKIDQHEDYKSRLNLWAMQNRGKISYRIAKEEGPAHHKTFYIELYVNDTRMGQGSGETKKRAEQDAARDFLQKIEISTV